jgi:hypothetical protein
MTDTYTMNTSISETITVADILAKYDTTNEQALNIIGIMYKQVEWGYEYSLRILLENVARELQLEERDEHAN